MSFIYTRNMSQGLLEAVDLETLNNDPIEKRIDLYHDAIALTSTAEWGPIDAVHEEYLYGFSPLPDRYWVDASANTRLCVSVVHNPDSINQRFVWNLKDGSQVVSTKDITEDCLCYIAIPEGAVSLSYSDGNKLVFLECVPKCVHPIEVAFYDNHGIPQLATLELSKFSLQNTAQSSFKSITGEIKYDLGKVPSTQVSAGLGVIPRQLMMFYSGLCNSEIYEITVPYTTPLGVQSRQVIHAGGAFQLHADNFTKTYTLEGTLNVNTEDLSILQEAFGEINIHSL